MEERKQKQLKLRPVQSGKRTDWVDAATGAAPPPPPDGVVYGILDTSDNLWIGDDNGPRQFTSYLIARVVAQVFEDQVLNTCLGGRFQAKPLPMGHWNKRDELKVNRGGLESLRRIEGEDHES